MQAAYMERPVLAAGMARCLTQQPLT